MGFQNCQKDYWGVFRILASFCSFCSIKYPVIKASTIRFFFWKTFLKWRTLGWTVDPKSQTGYFEILLLWKSRSEFIEKLFIIFDLRKFRRNEKRSWLFLLFQSKRVSIELMMKKLNNIFLEKNKFNNNQCQNLGMHINRILLGNNSSGKICKFSNFS